MEAVREIIRRLRLAGLTVHEWVGWETRSNGQQPAYRGGIIHHTGSPYGSAYASLATGRVSPALDGPLCNFAGNADGSLTVIAAGPANHAGASGGKSMGPLPVTTSFNRYVLGLEIVYPGVQPMTGAQYTAACAWARVVADVVGGGNIETIRAHAETSVTGKWDPGYAPDKTIDMRQFRADAAHTTEVAMTSPSNFYTWKDSNNRNLIDFQNFLYPVLAQIINSQAAAASALAELINMHNPETENADAETLSKLGAQLDAIRTAVDKLPQELLDEALDVTVSVRDREPTT